MRAIIVVAFVILLSVPASVAFTATPQRAPASGPHVFPAFTSAVLTPPVGSGPTVSVTNLVYHGGPVQHAPKVFLVFWDWHGAQTPVGNVYGVDYAGVGPYLVSFFSGLGGSGWANIQTQYYDGSATHIANPSGQLAGVWFDDSGAYDPYVDGSFGPAFIAQEAGRAADHFGYSKDANYMILLPPLADRNGRINDGYCAWHYDNARDSHGNVVAYTDMPYLLDQQQNCGGGFVNGFVKGQLDSESIVAGHEYAEAVTDPQLNAWWDSATGAENGDKCAWNQGPGAHAQNIVLPTGTFAVQSLWSNAISACAIKYP